MKTSNAAPSQLLVQFHSLKTAHTNSRHVDFETRRKWPDSLEAFLTDFEPQLIAAMQTDVTHRSREECMSLDLGTSASQVRYQRRRIKWWMRKRYVLIRSATQKPAEPLRLFGAVARRSHHTEIKSAPAGDGKTSTRRSIKYERFKNSHLTGRLWHVFSSHIFGPIAASYGLTANTRLLPQVFCILKRFGRTVLWRFKWYTQPRDMKV